MNILCTIWDKGIDLNSFSIDFCAESNLLFYSPMRFFYTVYLKLGIGFVEIWVKNIVDVGIDKKHLNMHSCLDKQLNALIW